MNKHNVNSLILTVISTVVLFLAVYLKLGELGAYFTSIIIFILILFFSGEVKNPLRSMIPLIPLLLIFSLHLSHELEPKPSATIVINRYNASTNAGTNRYNTTMILDRPPNIKVNISETPTALLVVYPHNCAFGLLFIRQKLTSSDNTPETLPVAGTNQDCFYSNGQRCYYYTLQITNSGSVPIKEVWVTGFLETRAFRVVNSDPKINLVGGGGLFRKGGFNLEIKGLGAGQTQGALFESSDLGDIDLKCNIENKNTDCKYIAFNNELVYWSKMYNLTLNDFPIEHAHIDDDSVTQSFLWHSDMYPNWQRVNLTYIQEGVC